MRQTSVPSPGDLPGNIWYLSHAFGLSQTVTPGIYDELATQATGSRAGWRKSRAMPVLSKTAQWVCLFPPRNRLFCTCLFSWHHWKPTHRVTAEGWGWKIDFWLAASRIACMNSESPLGRLLEGLAGILVSVHHDFGFKLNQGKLATKKVKITCCDYLCVTLQRTLRRNWKHAPFPDPVATLLSTVEFIVTPTSGIYYLTKTCGVENNPPPSLM